MSVILSIETSTPICSVALHQNDALLAESDLHLEKSHSGSLALLIEQLLAHCELTMQDLSAVAVSSGPGSYTGLRIGMSTAKGLCFALDIPLIGISSLDAMALQVKNYLLNSENTLLLPMIDARRMEVFYKAMNPVLKEIRPLSNLILELDSFNDDLDQYDRLVLFGNGAEKAEELYKDIRNLNIIKGVTPKAKFLGQLALDKYKAQDFESLAYFEPNYGKEFYSPVSKKQPFMKFKKD